MTLSFAFPLPATPRRKKQAIRAFDQGDKSHAPHLLAMAYGQRLGKTTNDTSVSTIIDAFKAEQAKRAERRKFVEAQRAAGVLIDDKRREYLARMVRDDERLAGAHEGRCRSVAVGRLRAPRGNDA
jgi:hypothetical protein